MSRAAIKPAKRPEILETIKHLEAQTHELHGVRFWFSLLSSDGDLTVVGGYDDKEACDRTSAINTSR
jgi:hypothetical protein